MKTIFLVALFWVLSLPLFAQTTGDWEGYITYTPKPVVTTVGFDADGLKWLDGIASKLGPDGFTYLGRRDDAHWLAFSSKGGTWTLQVHDESVMFNFQGLISPKTGRLTVEKGVSWKGLGKQADAIKSATVALEYADKARIAKDLFSSEAMAAPTPKTTSETTPMTSAKTAVKAPAKDLPMPKTKAPMVKAAPPPEVPTMATTPDTMVAVKMQPVTIGPPSPADGPWQKLVDGNLRFVSGKVQHPNQSMARVEETAKGQKPLAIVVSCSDSPVPPEVVLDQGIGDLYVIRTAGEVVTDVELGSIEYAVQSLGVPYLVVLGHKDCSIVDTTLKGGDLPSYIESVAAQIRPAAEAARLMKGDILDNAVRENIRNVVAKIRATSDIAEAIKDGKLNIKAAYYDTETGKVSALP